MHFEIQPLVIQYAWPELASTCCISLPLTSQTVVPTNNERYIISYTCICGHRTHPYTHTKLWCSVVVYPLPEISEVQTTACFLSSYPMVLSQRSPIPVTSAVIVSKNMVVIGPSRSYSPHGQGDIYGLANAHTIVVFYNSDLSSIWVQIHCTICCSEITTETLIVLQHALIFDDNAHCNGCSDTVKLKWYVSCVLEIHWCCVCVCVCVCVLIR